MRISTRGDLFSRSIAGLSAILKVQEEQQKPLIHQSINRELKRIQDRRRAAWRGRFRGSSLIFSYASCVCWQMPENRLPRTSRELFLGQYAIRKARSYRMR